MGTVLRTMRNQWAGFLALFLVLAGVASGATGDLLRLGGQNAADRTTALRNTGDGAALELRVEDGQPPLAVSSSVLVQRLNAALLAGREASEFALAGVSYTKDESDSRYTSGDNFYTKNEADSRFAEAGDSYTKTEADNRFVGFGDTYTKNEADNRFAGVGDVYTRNEADNRFAEPGDSYTKPEADTRFAGFGDSYTKNESDDRYAQASNDPDYQPADSSYTKNESDDRYAPATGSRIYADKDDVYSRRQADERYAPASGSPNYIPSDGPQLLLSAASAVELEVGSVSAPILLPTAVFAPVDGTITVIISGFCVKGDTGELALRAKIGKQDQFTSYTASGACATVVFKEMKKDETTSVAAFLTTKLAGTGSSAIATAQVLFQPLPNGNEEGGGITAPPHPDPFPPRPPVRG